MWLTERRRHLHSSLGKHAPHLLSQHHLSHLLLIERRLRRYHLVHLRLGPAHERITGCHSAKTETWRTSKSHHWLHLGHLRHLRHNTWLHSMHPRHSWHALQVLLLAWLLSWLTTATELFHRSGKRIVDLRG